MDERLKDYLDKKMDDINKLIEKYGHKDEKIPETLLAIVIRDDNIQLLKDYLIFGYATMPYNEYFGWIRPTDEILDFPIDFSFIKPAD